MGEWRYSSTILSISTRQRSVLAFVPHPLYYEDKAICTCCIGSWVGPRTALDTTDIRKFLTPAGNWTLILQLSSLQSTCIFFLFVQWNFGYWGHYWPIVPAPDDRWWWLWRNWWNGDWQGKPKYSEETCPSATLSTTNPTWPDPVLNTGRRGGKPATNRLSYGTACLLV
jgi:hypothetical protein